MSAQVIPIRRGSGRQPRGVEDLRDARDELTALVAERAETASMVVALARAAQRALARGWSAATYLDELERLGMREQVRAGAATAHAVCPDGETDRRSGHGKAA